MFLCQVFRRTWRVQVGWMCTRTGLISLIRHHERGEGMKKVFMQRSKDKKWKKNSEQERLAFSLWWLFCKTWTQTSLYLSLKMWCETLRSGVAMKTAWSVVASWTSSGCSSRLSVGVAHSDSRLKGKVGSQIPVCRSSPWLSPRGLNHNQPSVVRHKLSIHLPDKQSGRAFLRSALRWRTRGK